MASNSSIRLGQLNQSDLSGFITPIILGYLSQTGLLTGAFYPLTQNPAGYEISGAFISQQNLDSAIAQNTSFVFNNLPTSNDGGTSFNSGVLVGTFALDSQTGNFITTGQTGNFGGGNTPTGQLTGAFYPLIGNPSNYLTTGLTGSYIFHTAISSGVTQQFIHFPTDLGSNPYVFCSLVNTGSNSQNILVWPSGITHSGYWAQFSWSIYDNHYSLITLASLSTQTGLATTVIIQSGLPVNGIFTDSSSNSSLDVYNRELIGNWSVNSGMNISGVLNYQGTGAVTTQVPINTGVPKSWMPITVTGAKYFIPLFQ